VRAAAAGREAEVTRQQRALVERGAEGRAEKMQMLYDYLTGPEFRNRVAGFVEALAGMHGDFEREKRATMTMWKRREKILNRAPGNVTAVERERRDGPAVLPRRLPAREKLDVSEAR
jgi:hypothetical protein